MAYNNREDKNACNRRYYQRHKQAIAQKRAEFYGLEYHREWVAARSRVYQAILKGKLIRPTTCSSCGSPGKIEADHPDYNKPLDVTWLCKPCHVKITHKRKKANLLN